MSDHEEKQEESSAEKPLEWEQRSFRINKKMVDVCRLGVQVTEAEIAVLKRKLRKLQYGG